MPGTRNNRDELHLDRFLPYRLSVLANRVSAALAAAYSTRHDLTIPEWRVMAVLAREPGQSAAQVAERTAMDKVAVSRAVARLLASGRLRRGRTAADRRRSRLELTAAGRAVYGQIVPWALEYERRLLEALAPAEAMAFDAALGKLLRFATTPAAARRPGARPPARRASRTARRAPPGLPD